MMGIVNRRRFYYQTMNFLFQSEEEFKMLKKRFENEFNLNGNANKSSDDFVKSGNQFKVNIKNQDNSIHISKSYENIGINNPQNNKKIFSETINNDNVNINNNIHEKNDISEDIYKKPHQIHGLNNFDKIGFEDSNEEKKCHKIFQYREVKSHKVNELIVNSNSDRSLINNTIELSKLKLIESFIDQEKNSHKDSTIIEPIENKANKESNIKRRSLTTDKKMLLNQEISKLITLNHSGKNNTHNYFKRGENYKNKFIAIKPYEFFISIFCSKVRKNNKYFLKEKVFSAGEEKICQYLNVLNYFELYEDFEKFKSIILNEYQNLSFCFLRKRSFTDITDLNYQDKVTKTLYYFLENIDNISSIDRKLFHNLSNTFLNLFQIIYQ